MSAQILDITAPSPSTGNALVRTFRPLVEVRTWTATLHLLVNLAFGIAWFTLIVTLFSLSLGLMITLIGIPLLVLTINAGRAIGVVERSRARAMLGADLPAFPRPQLTGSFWQRTKKVFADDAGWRGMGFAILDLPWSIITFTVTVVVWSVSLAMAFFPIYVWFIPEDADGGAFHFGDNYVLEGWGRFGYTAGVTVIGLLFLIAAPRIVRGLARADLWLTKSILSPGPNRLLAERVEQLTVSRDASVEGTTVELRRIERDLHDGAQQRLVGLAMDLGLARERLAAEGNSEGATELVTRAHEEAKQAITELRDLVRGIHPQVLTDRGLDAALSAIVARSPVPISLDVVLDRRPPASIEAAAYFVVSEALANIAKHSRATRASITIRNRDGVLAIDIFDDGIGGAVEHPGGGLSGLRDRVTAVEGRLRISSPAGGPTLLAVELPCGS